MSHIIVLLLISLSGKSQTMNHYPRNAAVVVGQSVMFSCRTVSRNSAWWKYEQAGSKEDIILFQSKSSTESDYGNCSINKTEPGQNDLQMNNVRLSDAGTYTCVENKDNSTNVSVSKTGKHAAELIVLASVPECGTNLTGSNASLSEDNDSVQMWCSVRFRGNLAPVMEWRNGKETIYSRILIVPNNRVESEVIIQLKHDGIRGVIYSCTTYFNQSFSDAHANKSIVARNTPDYRYTWTTEEITYRMKLQTLESRESTASAMPNADETDRTYTATVIGLGIAVIILAISTITSFVGCIFAFKRIKKAKKIENVSSTVVDTQHVRPTAEYEEVHEVAEQSLRSPVYLNVPISMTEYADLEIIDQQTQQPRTYASLSSRH